MMTMVTGPGGPRGGDQRPGKVALRDESTQQLSSITRVSAAVNGKQPCEEQVHHCLLHQAWSQQHDQPVQGLMWCPAVTPAISSNIAPIHKLQHSSKRQSSNIGRQPHSKQPQGSPARQAHQAHQGCQSQTSTTARRVGRQGLKFSIAHAVHCGEQVAPAELVLETLAARAASQGQGVPRTWLQAAVRPLTQGPTAAGWGTVALPCSELS
ncbi:hypothetical protein HaLaN_00095 [Haematococcus lacustris]|uniref:Uncharacterized protein n=1 Tax=Haematococcus lacustris TaxID=44745 RepID=A0A699YEV0_HAELA|nr:hypothetical protein HaLaN_00095 [Haematococcus lacustris]